ncbi:MAG: formimidoylglutamase [Bacteroidales bacterium]|nr:formimidoylglutamase [Bacteroidales bacterium]
MDLSIYLNSIEIPEFEYDSESTNRQMGSRFKVNSVGDGLPELDGVQMAIIGVAESRNSVNNYGCSKAPSEVRKYLYKLFLVNENMNVADLGDIKAGYNIEDTYFAVKVVVEYLLKNDIIPVIIGGSQDITYANYTAYEHMGQVINIASIDSSFDLGNSDEYFNSRSYLSKIIMHQPNFLFNYTNIGYQSYFVDSKAVKLMQSLYFDVYRLGTMRDNMEEVEPLVRNADLVSFDISAIRQNEAPANENTSPNGFNGEEACRIARYAGISDKLTSFGIYEINPEKDFNGMTAHLAAQIIWYFMDGFYNRKGDFPHEQKEDYKKYNVGVDDKDHSIVFFESLRSGRWWMEVPLNGDNDEKYRRHYMLPCSYKDYKAASNREIPDRWWQVYQKMM